MVDLNLNENEVCYLSEDLARMPSLQTLRLQNNQLKLNGLPDGIFSESNVRKSTPPHSLSHISYIYTVRMSFAFQISQILVEGNLFEMDALRSFDG